MATIQNIDAKKITNNLEPFEPTHPGELLKEEIEFRGISQKKIAEQIGVQHTVLNEILNCKRPVNVQFAMLVEAALNIDAELLITMQTRYNMIIAKKDKTFSKRLADIRKTATIL